MFLLPEVFLFYTRTFFKNYSRKSVFGMVENNFGHVIHIFEDAVNIFDHAENKLVRDKKIKIPRCKSEYIGGFPFIICIPNYSSLMLLTGFSLAACQERNTTQINITQSKTIPDVIKINGFRVIFSANCSSHLDAAI